ncbi:MAG: triose-phosphate isomerase, partial [Methanothrix sp.]|nr:triose-phosphate isomerase [Methanothrix sp.]
MTIIVLNFKTYRESTGVEALRLAEICEDISGEYSVQMVVVPQVADIHAISKAVKIPVFAQHVDGVGYGGFTGHITAASLKAAGASGSLINHSERRLKLADIDAAI